MFSRSSWRLAPAMDDVVAAFKVLGLSYNPRATAASRPGVDDVRRQYREMARLHHPDLSSGDDNRMKVINTAYELIQSSGVLQGAYDPVRPSADASRADVAGAKDGASATATRFTRKAGTRRRRLPDDFASGDDASWSMKTQLDWQAMMNSSDAVTEAEMKNPANHPFSHSRFFSFEDDLSIYRMIRGGATVRQVARTLGKPATFVERRLQNAQFKLRVQYVLRQEGRKAGPAAAAALWSPSSEKGGAPARAAAAAAGASGPTTSTPITEPTTRRVLRRSPYEEPTVGGAAPSRSSSSHGSHATSSATPPPLRKKEWEASYPEWRAPRYRDQMSLEEQGRLDGLLRDTGAECGGRGQESRRHAAASKVGRSYENFQRMRPKR